MKKITQGLQFVKLLAIGVLVLSVSNTYAKNTEILWTEDYSWEIMPPQPIEEEPAPVQAVYLGLDNRPIFEIGYEFSCIAEPYPYTMVYFHETPQDKERITGACQISGYTSGYGEKMRAEWRGNTCFRVVNIMCVQ